MDRAETSKFVGKCYKVPNYSISPRNGVRPGMVYRRILAVEDIRSNRVYFTVEEFGKRPDGGVFIEHKVIDRIRFSVSPKPKQISLEEYFKERKKVINKLG